MFVAQVKNDLIILGSEPVGITSRVQGETADSDIGTKKVSSKGY